MLKCVASVHVRPRQDRRWHIETSPSTTAMTRVVEMRVSVRTTRRGWSKGIILPLRTLQAEYT